jgi:hypothetical protein
MLDERDSPIIGRPAAGRHAALAQGRIAHCLHRLAGSLGTADMRHLDALHAHVQQPQDERRVEAGRPDNRGDADALSRHNRELYIVQIVGGVLHVDKGGIEAGQPDDLDDLRIGDPADMCAQREPAFAQYPFYPILSHASLPWLGTILGSGVALPQERSWGLLVRQAADAAGRRLQIDPANLY